MPRELVLETQKQADKTAEFSSPAGGSVLLTPPVEPDYWTLRVMLSETQAIVVFPKFGGYGCGFAQEEDWNTNLPVPYCSPQEVFDHIIHNKGDDSIEDADVLRALEMVHAAVKELPDA